MNVTRLGGGGFTGLVVSFDPFGVWRFGGAFSDTFRCVICGGIADGATTLFAAMRSVASLAVVFTSTD
jgi:hypothetical protein